MLSGKGRRFFTCMLQCLAKNMALLIKIKIWEIFFVKIRYRLF